MSRRFRYLHHAVVMNLAPPLGNLLATVGMVRIGLWVWMMPERNGYTYLGDSEGNPL